jgi:uncharacterized protein
VRDINVFLIDLASARIATSTKALEAITGDLDDDLILACGVEMDVHIVVSGDRRHLLPIREYRGIRIITPQVLLAELAGE